MSSLCCKHENIIKIIHELLHALYKNASKGQPRRGNNITVHYRDVGTSKFFCNITLTGTKYFVPTRYYTGIYGINCGEGDFTDVIYRDKRMLF